MAFACKFTNGGVSFTGDGSDTNPYFAELASLSTQIRRAGANQSIPSSSGTYPGAFTRVDMDTIVNNDFGADLVNNRINLATTGRYLVMASMSWFPSATGQRTIAIGANNTTFLNG